MPHLLQTLAAVLTAAVTLTAPGFAQPLIEHVPADALVYVGWRGMDMAGDTYDESNLKGVLDATQLEAIVSQFLPALARSAAGDPESQQALEIMKQAVPLAWQRPWTFYLLDVPANFPADGSEPTMALLIDAGDQRNLVKGWLTQIVESYSGTGEPPRLVERDQVVGLMVGDASGDGSLRDADRFRTAQRYGVETPTGAVYVDVAAILGRIDAAVERSDDQAASTWHRVRDQLGLRGIDQFLYTAGFAGKDWRGSALLHMPQPRVDHGLPALLEAEPVTDDHLKLVPRSATWLYATHFDVASLFDVIRRAVVAGGAEAADTLDQHLAQASFMTGVDLEADLIRSLGDTWLLYSDPAVAGPIGFGAVLVNPLKNAPRVERALAALEAFANAQMAGEDHGTGPLGAMRFKMMTSGDMKIHSLTFPMFAPSWAVHDGKLYAAVFPQAIVSAHLYAKQEGNSILQNDKFQAIRARLGSHRPATMSFTDLPATAGGTYQSYLMLTQMLTAMMPHDTAPTMLLPPLAQIMPYLSPAGSMSWTDDIGWHFASTSPFPGSSLLSQQAMMNPFGGGTAATAAMGVGILLPALGAARQTARQMQTNTQARGIHQSCVMYAQGSEKDHRRLGTFPPDLQTLFHGNYFTIDYLVAPTSSVGVPAGFQNWDREQQDQWIQHNSSFVLLPGLAETLDPDEIALFLKPGHSDGRGLSVAYQDNHVEWMSIEDGAAKIEAQTGLTIEQLVAHAEAGTLTVDTPGYTLPPED